MHCYLTSITPWSRQFKPTCLPALMFTVSFFKVLSCNSLINLNWDLRNIVFISRSLWPSGLRSQSWCVWWHAGPRFEPRHYQKTSHKVTSTRRAGNPYRFKFLTSHPKKIMGKRGWYIPFFTLHSCQSSIFYLYPSNFLPHTIYFLQKMFLF